MVRGAGFPDNFIQPDGTGPLVFRLITTGCGEAFYGVKAMQRLTREDVIKAIGGVDDVTIAQIIGMNATADELAEAQAWLANDEPLLNAGRPLATGRVRELVDILSDLEPGDDDDGREAPAASMDQG